MSIVLLYVLLGLALLIIMIGYNYFFRIYFQAQMAEAPVPLLLIIGLTLRGVNARAIVGAHAAAAKAGIETDFNALAAHAKAGGNARRVVTTLIEAKQSGGAVTFEQACQYDLSEHGVIEFPEHDDKNIQKRAGHNGS
jgi:uncharacterized protein YqfA (UPF0365 family)